MKECVITSGLKGAKYKGASLVTVQGRKNIPLSADEDAEKVCGFLLEQVPRRTMSRLRELLEQISF